jgi:protein-tyrosine phosphatase
MMSELPPEFVDRMADLTSQRIEGIAVMGGVRFSCPIVSQIDGNLWSGGCPAPEVPAYFKYVLNLYPWMPYHIPEGTEVLPVALLDHGTLPDIAKLEELAAWVNEKSALAPTLVHCQAGLNRSGLVTTLALIRRGMKPDDAIALIRAKRSPAVLCNQTFERWLRTL